MSSLLFNLSGRIQSEKEFLASLEKMSVAELEALLLQVDKDSLDERAIEYALDRRQNHPAIPADRKEAHRRLQQG